MKPGQTFVMWLLACAAGEAVGLTLSGTIGAIVVPKLATQSELVIFGLMVIAGALEGACVGVAQVLVLRRAVPSIRVAPFVAATAIAFAVGWIWGAVFTFFETEAQTLADVLKVALASGAGLGFAVGGLQSLALRNRSGRPVWIAGNVAAWALGLVASFFGARQIPPGDWEPYMLGVGLATGVGVGLVVGAVTVIPLLRLQRA